ncbi:MAG: type II toxin-antitoxin system VapC family toxin [Armatimonadota bacterium]
MKIVDTVGWLAYLAGGALGDAYEKHILAPDEPITPSTVLHEVFKHALRASGEEAARSAASVIQMSPVIDLDGGLAISAARCSLSHKLPRADAFICATALSHEATVLTSKHFEGLQGVVSIPLPGQQKPAEEQSS